MKSLQKPQNILRQHRLRPSKKLGQNFLIDRKILYKIIGASDLSENDIVVEVGPGLGTLTIELARRVKKVIAIEKDKKIVAVLKEILEKNNIQNVKIIEGDIRKLNFNYLLSHPEFISGSHDEMLKQACPEEMPKQVRHDEFRIQHDTFGVQRSKISYKVVANIPYYLTSPLIRKFLETEVPPKTMVLMLQKEVARRICAKPPRMTLLSVAVQFYAGPKIVSLVSKKSFWPQPKVDSAIIKMTPRNVAGCHPEFISGSHAKNIEMLKQACPEEMPKRVENKFSASKRHDEFGVQHDEKQKFINSFFKVVRAGFSHPRKQLANNLSTELKIDRQKIENFLERIQLKPAQRAEELTVDNWRILTVLIVENVV